ncbi:MAG: PASTA domain-containing protein [Clostridia bacterium]|nr:PASTA domain-containing protein [Clostridia bacterium]
MQKGNGRKPNKPANKAVLDTPKKPSKNSDDSSSRQVRSRKLIAIMSFSFLLLVLLIGRLFWIEIVKGAEYKEIAYNQQTINRIISPKRGTIYDSTGMALAVSSRVDTVTINPGKVRYSSNKKVESEILAKNLAEIFELDYDAVLEKVNSTSSVETIAKKVEQDKINKLKEWMNTNKITAGINIDEDYKRYYPYNNFASAILGFCGTDNQGLWGLENSLDETLTGTPGKIMTSANVVGQEIPDENRQYIAAQNGNDVVLSIDYKIQSIAEKYLKQAVIENGCENGGNVIIMNPETGDIYAMANYPDYDLNSPYTPNEKLAKTWDELTSEEKTNSLYEMWRNKAASATYEPGSTFKLITASIALEEGIVEPDYPRDFICNGSYTVDGVDVSCWNQRNPHWKTNLREALEGSCNPAFIQLGLKIGVSRFYRYMRAYGLFESTHSGLYGESSSIMHDEDRILKIELATMAFGQRFTITPLQLITAVSAIVNDGVLMQPRIVKQTINSDTGVVTNIDPVAVRQVISKETSEEMCDMMRSVVVDGTGGNADVKGYSIGGKSGTSEPRYTSKADGYVASFIGVAPTTDVKVVVLVTLYKPTGSRHQGGEIAAPVVNQIFTDILPYLGISSSDNNTTVTSNNSNRTEILLSDVRNKTFAEAEKILKNAGFKVVSSIAADKESTLVSDQVPKPGVKLLKNSTIYLYTQDDSVRVSVSVPDLRGMSADQAINSIRSKDLNIILDGSGSSVISQDYVYGTQVERGTIITVTMKDELKEAR